MCFFFTGLRTVIAVNCSMLTVSTIYGNEAYSEGDKERCIVRFCSFTLKVWPCGFDSYAVAMAFVI